MRFSRTILLPELPLLNIIFTFSNLEHARYKQRRYHARYDRCCFYHLQFRTLNWASINASFHLYLEQACIVKWKFWVHQPFIKVTAFCCCWMIPKKTDKSWKRIELNVKPKERCVEQIAVGGTQKRSHRAEKRVWSHPREKVRPQLPLNKTRGGTVH